MNDTSSGVAFSAAKIRSPSFSRSSSSTTTTARPAASSPSAASMAATSAGPAGAGGATGPDVRATLTVPLGPPTLRAATSPLTVPPSSALDVRGEYSYATRHANNINPQIVTERHAP